MNENEPHEGYNILLNYLKKKMNENYFICTSNVDNYFEKAGFDKNKIYEAHGPVEHKDIRIPDFNPENFVAVNMPKCLFC